MKKKKMEPTVYTVHCIDTEGPMYESLEATFQRIKDIHGLDLDVSLETLKKLQHKSIDLGGKEDAVYNLVAPKRLQMNSTWDQIDAMLDRITAPDFRLKHADSFGGGWIYNWFCVDQVGYTGENPRRKDLGYHNIFDHYHHYMKQNNITSDGLGFHYHPPAILKDSHRSGTTYLNSSNIYKILARRIIDRQWFPSVNRAGFHTERPDSHWFWEQWLPFDYANQAVKGKGSDQPDLIDGRFGDWRRAPRTWIPYRPDFYDYQKPGQCKRHIARCLNMSSRLRELTIDDVRDAFHEARLNQKSLLSFTNHDFRDMAPEISTVWDMINTVAKEFKDVRYRFVDALEGMRKVLDLEPTPAPGLSLSLEKQARATVFHVEAKHEIFGLQPFLAIKVKGGDYFWENFDFRRQNHWSFTFDYNNIEIDAVEKVGAAANTIYGTTEVAFMDLTNGNVQHVLWNQ